MAEDTHISPGERAKERLLTLGIAPGAAIELRALLRIPPDADDQHVVHAVFNALQLRDAALDAGFTKTFTEALLSGRAKEADRAFWSDRFYRDPDTTREDLAHYWRPI